MSYFFQAASYDEAAAKIQTAQGWWGGSIREICLYANYSFTVLLCASNNLNEMQCMGQDAWEVRHVAVLETFRVQC